MYTVLGASSCAFCKQAIQLLATKGESFTYLDARKPVNADMVEAQKAKGHRSIPQIWKGDRYLGGFKELQASL